MKTIRIISTILAMLMLVSVFTIGISAEDTVQYEYNTTNAKPTFDYMTGQSVEPEYDKDGKLKGYKATGEKVVYNAEDKLETMDFRFEKDGYQLYVDEYSGEVATRSIALLSPQA